MEKNNATVLLIVVGVLALLVGCTFGVLVGGAEDVARLIETGELKRLLSA
jgi:hypothetical protein